jgi:hypothetical protein
MRCANCGLLLVLLAILAEGCDVSGDPELLRQRSRHVYTLDVPCPPIEVHKTLIAACQEWGWTAGAALHQEFYPEQQVGTVMIYNDQVGSGQNGFIADLKADGPNRTNVTVYARNTFYAEASQQCFENALRVKAVPVPR